MAFYAYFKFQNDAANQFYIEKTQGRQYKYSLDDSKAFHRLRAGRTTLNPRLYLLNLFDMEITLVDIKAVSQIKQVILG